MPDNASDVSVFVKVTMVLPKLSCDQVLCDQVTAGLQSDLELRGKGHDGDVSQERESM